MGDNFIEHATVLEAGDDDEGRQFVRLKLRDRETVLPLSSRHEAGTCARHLYQHVTVRLEFDEPEADK